MNSLTKIVGRGGLRIQMRNGVQIQRHFNSTQQQQPQHEAPNPTPTKASTPTSEFYKTFTRPVAKVLLMATFTYQLAYWAWVKLEKDELKKQKTEEVAALEAQLEALTKKTKAP